MTDRISFEHFIRRWAWSPYKGLHRALRPTPQEALDIARSFKRDPDLVMSYISDVTGGKYLSANFLTGQGNAENAQIATTWDDVAGDLSFAWLNDAWVTAVQ